MTSTPFSLRVPAVILARGGSKGIPRKNLMPLCGRPLLSWTVEFALASASCSGVWVSTDSEEIAEAAEHAGASVIVRPADLAGDASTSESGWLHAIEHLQACGVDASVVAGLQTTSPLRLPSDLDDAVRIYVEEGLDSLFSGSVLDDLTLWEKHGDGLLQAVNHDPTRRVSRQEAPVPIVENGSIYLMRSALLISTGTRFAGRVGFSPNRAWQSTEIDSLEGAGLCEILMRRYIL